MSDIEPFSEILVVPKTAMNRPSPLLITDDPELLDDLVGIAGKVGVDLEVAPDPVAAKSRYPAAPLVFISASMAFSCAQAELPRRPGVVLVGRGNAAEQAWSAAEMIGAEHVALLPTAESWLADRITESSGKTHLNAGRVVTVIGGRGGAGATVLATGLAVTGSRTGINALLIDADPLGGGVDLVLGWESIDGVRWPAFRQTRGRVSHSALVEALPHRGDLAVLSWDRGNPLSIPVDAMSAALDAGREGSQLIIVDLPRSFDSASTVALAASDLALLVVPAELRACAAAARVAARVSEYTTSMALVVRGPAPGKLKAREISRALGLNMIGVLRSEPDLARGLERGDPPASNSRGSLSGLCRQILVDLGLRSGVAA